jgi:cytochrome c peroxidase
MHQLKELDMLSAKMDLLMKRLKDKAPEKKEVMQLFKSRMTCEECGNTGHLGSQCPQLEEDVNYINNNNQYHPQQNKGWTQQRTNYLGNCLGNYQGNNSSDNFSPLKDLVQNQGRIMDNLSEKLASNDKMQENISNKMESFSLPSRTNIALIKY